MTGGFEGFERQGAKPAVGAQESSEGGRTVDYEVLADCLFRQWCAMPTVKTQSCDAQTDRVVYILVTIIPDKGRKREAPAHGLLAAEA